MVYFRLGLSQSKMQDPRTLVGTFILFNLLVVSELKAVDALPALNTSSSTHDEESWDISTDNVAAYSIIPMLDLESLMKENANKESHPSRQKRSAKVKNIVFREVSSSQIRSLPYYGTVRISDICSGTMIGDSHVLTAAHCVHDGRNNFKLSKLRVGKCFNVHCFIIIYYYQLGSHGTSITYDFFEIYIIYIMQVQITFNC